MYNVINSDPDNDASFTLLLKLNLMRTYPWKNYLLHSYSPFLQWLVAIDLEGYYITAKGGISKTLDTGTLMTYITGDTNLLNNEDLGTGSAFGFSAGKYITDNFRLELEAIKRTSYELDAHWS